MKKEDISKTDWLAIERTKLANERTLLAYFRTFVVVFGSGLTLVKVDLLKGLESLGYIFIGLSLVFLLIGLTRFYFARKRINRYYSS